MIKNDDFGLIKDSIRNIPDFPKKGIQFKDLTTALKQPQILNNIVNSIAMYYADKKITKVAAMESRGFITGGAIAYRLGAGFIPVRKPGKLPAATFSKSYELEYGNDSLEIHCDALSPEDIVLVHDDLIATGGTSIAVLELIKYFNVTSVFINFIVELSFLKGRDRFAPDYDIYSLIKF